MWTTRILLLAAVCWLPACSSPTEPNSLALQTSKDLPSGQSQFGPPCGTTGPKVLCSGRQ